jgi:hypothetical protein
MVINSLQSVERDGTGIKAWEAAVLFAETIIRADITQDVLMEHGSSGCPAERSNGMPVSIEGFTWH